MEEGKIRLRTFRHSFAPRKREFCWRRSHAHSRQKLSHSLAREPKPDKCCSGTTATGVRGGMRELSQSLAQFFPRKPVTTIHNFERTSREKFSSQIFNLTEKKFANMNGSQNSNLKRSYSVSDSDDCSEDEGRNCAVTSGSQTYRSPTRKRRRGVIEKRRRDRINCSLDELKRLVPHDGRPLEGASRQQGVRLERFHQGWIVGHSQDCNGLSWPRCVSKKHFKWIIHYLFWLF